MYSFLVDCLYDYANVAVLGLFAGCVWYAWQTVFGPKTAPWFSLAQQLTTPRILFGDWLSGRRLSIGSWLFTLAAVVYQFEIFFANSLYRYRIPWLFDYGTVVLDHILALCLLGKILLCTRYDGRQLAVAFGTLFVIRWVFMNNHDKWMLLALLFALAAKDVPLRRALKAVFTVGAASVVVVAVSSLLGVINTVQELGTGRYRNSFGYGWYNFFGACLLGLAVMYVCLRGIKRLKWFDFALLAAVTLLCNFGPDSRAATMCLCVLMVAALVVRIWPVVLRPLPVRILLAAAPVLAFVASMILAFLWNPDNPVLAMLDRLLSTRISLGWEALQTMPFAIAGQMPADGMLVDNAYLHYWLVAGPVASALIWGGFALLVWRLLKQGHATEAICCLVMICHGTMEGHVIWACVNVTIWLLCGVIFWPERQPSFSCAEETKKVKIHSKGAVTL